MSENPQLRNLKDKLFGKNKEYNLLDVYHYLMVHYGYIPFSDFKKMDAHLVDELVTRLDKMNSKQPKLPKGRKSR